MIKIAVKDLAREAMLKRVVTVLGTLHSRLAKPRSLFEKDIPVPDHQCHALKLARLIVALDN
jgi:hypothetical protein